MGFVVVAHWCGPQAYAPGTWQGPCHFAAALCEFSGSFLLFHPARRTASTGHHEAREALVLSIAGVTAIMLTAYLLLLILY
jgi:hypothetical protein